MEKLDDIPLEHFSYGKATSAGTTVGGFGVLACSPGLPLQQAERYYLAASVGSYTAARDISNLDRGYAMIKMDESTWVLSMVRQANTRDRGYIIPRYHLIIIPGAALPALSGNLDPIVDLFRETDLSENNGGMGQLETIRLSIPARRSLEEKVPKIAFLYEAFKSGEHACLLLRALLNDRPVIIKDAPDDAQYRLNLIQGLWTLLPSRYSAYLTFATEVFESNYCRAILKFLYRDPLTQPGDQDCVFLLSEGKMTAAVPAHPYADFLETVWNDGPRKLLEAVAEWELRYEQLYEKDHSPHAALQRLGNKMKLAYQVRLGNPDPETLANNIEQDSTLSQNEIENYLLMLLTLCVRESRLNLLDLFDRIELRQGVLQPIQEWLISLARDGHGDEVLRLLKIWMTPKAGSKIREVVWTRLYYSAFIEHLNYCCAEEKEDRLLAFIGEADQDAQLRQLCQSRQIENVWPEVIHHLLPLASKYRQIALLLVRLVCYHQPETLPKLFSSHEIVTQWPPALQVFAYALAGQTGSSPVKPGALLEASRSVPGGGLVTLLKFVQLASQTKSTGLLDSATWNELTRYASDASLNSQRMIADTLSVKNLREWYQILPDEKAVVAFTNLSIALGDIRNSVALITQHLQSARKSQADGTLFLQNFCSSIPEITHSRAIDFLEELEAQRISPVYLAGAQLGMADRLKWPEVLIKMIAKFRIARETEVVFGEADALKLIEYLNLINRGTPDVNIMIKENVRISVQEALNKPQYAYQAVSLARLAKTVRGQEARDYITHKVREHAHGLTPDRLQMLYEQVSQYAELKQEAASIEALLTVVRVLGSQDLRDYLVRLQNAFELLRELQNAFGPETMRKGKLGFDWQTFEAELRSQFANVTTNDLDQLCARSVELAQLIGNMGDQRKKPKILQKQEDMDWAIFTGKEAAESAVDALLRMGGIFNPRRVAGKGK